ncbi:MAG: reverse transcriptase domain-containing protein, partial [Myxococcales bacterium]
PLLSNVYLHYAFDLWAQNWRRKHAHGDVVIVRYADDVVVGFQHRADAERFRVELEERFRKFNLELHPEKTRLLEFGRPAGSSGSRCDATSTAGCPRPPPAIHIP